MDLPLVESLAARLRRRSVVVVVVVTLTHPAQAARRLACNSARDCPRPPPCRRKGPVLVRPPASRHSPARRSHSRPSPAQRSVSRRQPPAAVRSHPAEHTVGNTVRKVLHHMREEYHTAIKSTAPATHQDVFSISRFVLQGQPRHHSAHKSDPDKLEHANATDQDHTLSEAEALKPVLLEAIQDVLDELETVYDNVSKNAKDHIHSEFAPSSSLSLLLTHSHRQVKSS